jgi:serine protease inhibitor
MTELRPWLRWLFALKKTQPFETDLKQVAPSRHSASFIDFTQEDNDFGLAIYGLLRQQPGNVVFSPLSIRTVLAMAYSGTRGTTADQMREALRFPSSDETSHLALAEIIQRLNAGSGSEYEMAVANGLWAQKGARLEASFLDLLLQHYGSSTSAVDFRHRAEKARATINEWVEDQTRRRIRDLIPSGSLNADTRLVLVNAVYFKGKWVLQFWNKATHHEPFWLDNGETVQVPLMHQQERFRYLQGRGYKAVELDYHGCELSMLLLLPDRKDGLADFDGTISPQMLHQCVSRLRTCEVELFLPRFRFTSGTINLNKQLAALGMTLPFDRSQADFSGINGHKPPHEEALFLSAVLHQALVEVNEEGTEAAAATAAVVLLGSSPIRRPRRPVPVFRADHPFLFAIRDRTSGALLFLGRVADPRQF